ncbi:MAG: PKD domain-containing protein [Bacteroidota bacterium]
MKKKISLLFIIGINFFLFSFSLSAQLPKWILGNSQQTSSGNFYSLSSGNLKFYEVDFTGTSPVVNPRILGNSINSIVSRGSQDVINNALDNNGNILFYLFCASRTAYNNFSGIVSDTVYFVSYNPSTNADEVFGKTAAINRISSVIEHALCPRPNYPGQYYFIYKTRLASNISDDIKYVIVDGINKTVSLPVTIVSGEKNGEGFALSKYDCANDRYWLFSTRLESTGFITIRRTEINPLGLMGTTDVYTINLTNNISGAVITAIEISSLGNTLAMCLFSNNSNKAVSIFDFNISTGALSNERYYTNSSGYGIVTCEFSRDGTRLYIMQGGSSSFPNIVYNCPVISSGSYTITSANSVPSIIISGSLAMELAYDDKIYVNKGHNENSFYCITNPNSASPTVVNTISPFFGTSIYRIGDAFPDQIDGDNGSFLNASISVSSDTICQGQSAVLTGNGGQAYQWSGGVIDSVSTITVSPSIATTYYLEVSNGSCLDFDSVTINVDSRPTAYITGIDTICSGQSITLTAIGGSSYQWSGGITSSTSSINVSPSIITTYTVVAINSGCSSLPEEFTVIVNPTPDVSIVGATLICDSSISNYSANIAGGTAPFNYLWTNSDTSPNINILHPLSSTSLIGIEVTDVNNCSDTASLNVTSLPYPLALISGPLMGCPPLNVSFTNQSINATNYLWNFGDGTTSVFSTPAHLYSTSGSYAVSLIAYNSAGCSDTTTEANFITINPSPHAGVGVSVSDSNALLTTIFNQSQQSTTCVLYFGDGDSLVGCNWNEVFHTYQEMGDYVITQIVMNSNGCTDTIEINVAMECESKIFIPNAFTPDGNGLNDLFYIYGNCLNDYKLMIFDRGGELMYETTDITKGWNGMYKLKPVEQDVYVWKLFYTNSTEKTKKEKIGHVTVVR